MRIAYFDCAWGISGTLALAALIDAGADEDVIRKALEPVGAFDLAVEEVAAGTVRATRVTVRAAGREPTRGHLEVVALLRSAALPAHARLAAEQVYGRLAEAEAAVHGTSPDRVTFHEIASIRSLVGVAGTALALDLLGVERVAASPVGTGWGRVQTAHGLLPNPAPATRELLRDIPVESRDVQAELVTPTGAAILGVWAEWFGPMPQMTVEVVGHGAGTGGVEPQNVLRVTLGEG